MIKTKIFTGYFTNSIKDRVFIDVDKEINQFLESNNIELIDIKYAVSVDLDGQSWNNALMIYKEIS
ncbi:sporulation protein Cse60 [Bacillus xiapuensis]|uniref:Sporulation protein Cse60 n=1 Tax=Bacillus xiapuensis TaxID=2014075 RepID=A0ABU6N8M3_9BACI|nr:sporulation protein Cse60 [Bacillus xiapuensis]